MKHPQKPNSQPTKINPHTTPKNTPTHTQVQHKKYTKKKHQKREASNNEIPQKRPTEIYPLEDPFLTSLSAPHKPLNEHPNQDHNQKTILKKLGNGREVHLT